MLREIVESLSHGISAGLAHYREARRLSGEFASFSEAYQLAGDIEGWLSRAQAELLYTLAGRVPSGSVIVEIGSFCGRSTAFLGLGSRNDVPVYAIDPHTGDRSWVEKYGLEVDTSKRFILNMQSLDLTDRVHPLVATSRVASERWSEKRPIGLLFIDGWHSADAVAEDGRLWLPRLADDGYVVFDDWYDDEIQEGVSRLKDLLPPLLGFVDKDLVFGPASPEGVRLRRLKRRHVRAVAPQDFPGLGG